MQGLSRLTEERRELYAMVLLMARLDDVLYVVKIIQACMCETPVSNVLRDDIDAIDVEIHNKRANNTLLPVNKEEATIT